MWFIFCLWQTLVEGLIFAVGRIVDLMLLLITLRLIMSPMVFGCQQSERLDLLLHKIKMNYKIIANGVNVSYQILYTNALTNKMKESSLGLSTLSAILSSDFVFHLCNEVGFGPILRPDALRIIWIFHMERADWFSITTLQKIICSVGVNTLQVTRVT